ncbi:unnamed protein product [Auanema sp. JU1783]|nr:unnamed protein product [Auanema sp. JU1783]
MSYISQPVNSPSRSQNRVTFASSTSSVSIPHTPKSRTPGQRRNTCPRRQNSNSNPCFAGSKFSDSPSARAIPLPPSDWFGELCNSGSESDTGSMAESVSSTDRAGSVSSQSSMEAHSPVGIRLNPLQLIAAVTVGAS